jgi:hypothetical protein
MEQAIIPLPNRRRLNAQDRALRRKRIFARLRDGWAYDEIAREERLTTERVREIVDEVLQKRRVDASPAHALLQLDRLAGPLRVASGAVAGGDVKSISPLLRTLKAIDGYQKAAAQAREVYEDEISEKLIAKMKRLAATYDEDEAEESAAESAAMVRAAQEAWCGTLPAKAAETSTKETAAPGPAESAAASPDAGWNVAAGRKYIW